MYKHDKEMLNWSYEMKVEHSKKVIKDFLHITKDEYANFNEPVIAFSGGKDSCVLEHLVHSVDKDIKLYTSMEMFHPEIAKHLKNFKTTFIKSKMSFEKSIDKYGVPFPSKEVARKIYEARHFTDRASESTKKYTLDKIPQKYKWLLTSDIKVSDKCCNCIKGNLKKNKHPKIIGTRAEESRARKSVWLKNGCIYIDNNRQQLTPISIWRESDVERYIKENNIKISKAYEMGWKRTGCLMCGFGTQFKEKRQELLLVKKYYPNVWNKYAPYYVPIWEKMGYTELLEQVEGYKKGE